MASIINKQTQSPSPPRGVQHPHNDDDVTSLKIGGSQKRNEKNALNYLNSQWGGNISGQIHPPSKKDFFADDSVTVDDGIDLCDVFIARNKKKKTVAILPYYL